MSKFYVMQGPTMREQILRFISALPLHKPWGITVEPYSKRRTSNRNSMMHALWGEFGRELGWTKEEAKEWFKENHGPRIEKVIGDEVFYVVKPSSKYTTQEAEAMCDAIHRVAAEHGVMLADPHMQGEAA